MPGTGNLIVDPGRSYEVVFPREGLRGRPNHCVAQNSANLRFTGRRRRFQVNDVEGGDPSFTKRIISSVDRTL